jgi:hypothetical protein
VRRVLLLALIACQSHSGSVRESAAKHTQADRTHAMAALSAALDEVYAVLKANPADTAGALGRARPQIEKYYTPDEAAAFELWTGSGEWLLYIPTQPHTSTVWLARTTDHLVVEPDALPPEAKAKVGL